MPYTFNGCGTRFYGERDKAADGSYVTTEWITIVYLPLVPLRSFRVLPVGKGTNYVIHSSQSYQTLQVPLCWPQVRNVYLFAAPIILLILYFDRQGINNWIQQDVLKSRTVRLSVQAEKPVSSPAEQPLTNEEAAVACGKVLKLDTPAFSKLNIMNRISNVVSTAGFTEREIKTMGDSTENLEKQAFKAYSFAYVSWDKPTESRVKFDKMVVDVMNSQDVRELSADEQAAVAAYMTKMKRMMLQAFELGRQDARISPCP